VFALIRGGDVNQALATLKFSRKRIARDIEKVLRSAIANAQQKPGFSGDVERLYVSACYADQGPSQKRVRPGAHGARVPRRQADGAPDGGGGGAAREGGRAGAGQGGQGSRRRGGEGPAGAQVDQDGRRDGREKK